MQKISILFIWILIIASLVYIYFYQPQLFQQIFNYPGPGSPFVNTPNSY